MAAVPDARQRSAEVDIGVSAPSTPHELVVRFIEVTSADVETACWYIDSLEEYAFSLDAAIAHYFDHGAAGAAAANATPAPMPPPAPAPRAPGTAAAAAEPRAREARLEMPAAKRLKPEEPEPAAKAAAEAAERPRGGGAGGGVGEAEAPVAGELPDGGEIYVEGGSGKYRITRRGDVYSCSCPSWRNQRLGPFRTCKHIKDLRGDDAERQRLVDKGHTSGLEPVRGGLGSGGGGSSGSTAAGRKAAAAGASGGRNPSIEKRVMLAHKWQEGKVNPTGYLMSEKLDGMRAIWDAGAFWSRVGNPIAVPAYFSAALPAGVRLDGELFLGRGRFQDVMSVCRSQVPSEAAWREVRYVIFDAPDAAGGLAKRLDAAKEALREGKEHVARVHPHEVCRGAAHVAEELARVLALTPPAEGLMLAVPNKPHRGGRCTDILKVKEFHTEDAKVVGYKLGKGRLADLLGALECRLRSGARFDVGSGFADAEREDHETRYPLGAIVEFRYFELSDHGVPRFPTFVRLRPDVDASEFP